MILAFIELLLGLCGLVLVAVGWIGAAVSTFKLRRSWFLWIVLLPIPMALLLARRSELDKKYAWMLIWGVALSLIAVILIYAMISSDIGCSSNYVITTAFLAPLVSIMVSVGAALINKCRLAYKFTAFFLFWTGLLVFGEDHWTGLAANATDKSIGGCWLEKLDSRPIVEGKISVDNELPVQNFE